MSPAGSAVITFLFTGFALSFVIVRGFDFLLGLIK